MEVYPTSRSSARVRELVVGLRRWVGRGPYWRRIFSWQNHTPTPPRGCEIHPLRMSYKFLGLPTTESNGTVIATNIERYAYTTTTVTSSLFDKFGSITPGGTIAFVGLGFITAIYLAMCIVFPGICLLSSVWWNQNRSRASQKHSR